jgi:Bacterial SH3 domain
LVFASGLFATSARAGNPPGFAYCGTYGSYVLVYRSTENFEELGKLRCGEKVEVLSRIPDYAQVRTIDGRVGWVHWHEISNYPGAAPSGNFGLTDPNAKQQGAGAGAVALNNAAIVKMRTQHLSADVMVAKIKVSPCEFDTTPPALQKLKTAGVPDKVILAMVMAPSASAPPPPPVAKPEFVDVKVPGGTQIDLELTYAASSDEAADGRPILMAVAHDVMIDGAVVFRAGAEAHARVVSFKEPGFMNRPPGTLAWTMDYVTAANGEHVAAEFFSKEAAENPMSAVMGSPGPSWEFKKGKPAVVAAKTKFQAVLSKKGTVVRVAQADVQARAAGDDSAGASVSGSGKP